MQQQVEISSNSSTITQTNKAPILSATICLIFAWISAITPMPFISSLMTFAFNIAAFVLAIICISRTRIFPGISVLAGSLIITPILYFLSYPLLLALGFASAMNIGSGNRTMPQHIKSQSTEGQTKENIKLKVNVSGKWQGEYIYKNYPPILFDLEIQTDGENVIHGKSTEQIKVKDQTKIISADVSGQVNGSSVEFKKVFTFNQSLRSVTYSGALIGKDVIEGAWHEPSVDGRGKFRMHRI